MLGATACLVKARSSGMIHRHPTSPCIAFSIMEFLGGYVRTLNWPGRDLTSNCPESGFCELLAAATAPVPCHRLSRSSRRAADAVLPTPCRAVAGAQRSATYDIGVATASTTSWDQCAGGDGTPGPAASINSRPPSPLKRRRGQQRWRGQCGGTISKLDILYIIK